MNKHDMRVLRDALRRNVHTLTDIRKTIDNFWTVQIGSVKLPDGPSVLDGFRIGGELKMFISVLRQKMPSLEFIADASSAHGENSNFGCDGWVIRNVGVYVRGSDHIVGQIGYSDRHSKNHMYWVHSPRIKNEKYKQSNTGYYTATSKDLDRAVKHAQTYLRPLTATEVGVLSIGEFGSKLKQVRNRVYMNRSDAFDKLTSQQVLLTELRSLIQRGVEFTSHQFAEDVRAALKEQDEWDAMVNRQSPARFVVVSTVGTQQYVEMQRVGDMVNFSDGKEEYGALSAIRMKIEDAPESIVGKLSVLCLAEQGQYMEGVGYRYTENTFWVEE